MCQKHCSTSLLEAISHTSLNIDSYSISILNVKLAKFTPHELLIILIEESKKEIFDHKI